MAQSYGEEADGFRREGEAVRSRPLWQPYDTTREKVAGLLGAKLDPTNRRHH
jgi:hypothetical protein